MAFFNKFKFPAIVVGILMIVLGGYDFYKSNQVPVDFNELMEADIKSGLMVEGDISGNLGVYEESYDTNYGIKNKATEVWYYIIPVGEESYMGLAVNANLRGAEFDAQTEETYDYISGDSSSAPRWLHIEGSINKMSNQDQGFFREAMGYLGFEEKEIDQYMVPYYVSVGSYGQYMELFVIGAVALVFGIVGVVVTKGR